MQIPATIAGLIKTLAPLFKFAVVGSIGLVIDFGITLLLRDGLLVNGYLSSTCGFAVAASSNYYINSKWTFKENATTSSSKQFVLFFIISLIGLGLKLLLLRVFQNAAIPFYTSKILAVAVIFMWNFMANKFITFRKTTVTGNPKAGGTYHTSFSTKKILNGHNKIS